MKNQPNERLYSYIPAVLRTNKEWYIEFSYCDRTGKMRRSRKYLNCAIKRLPTLKAKREYASHELQVINMKLMNGWTPEHDKEVFANPKSATTWREVFVRYRLYLRELEDGGELRHAGALTYASNIGILEDWIKREKVPDKKERKKKVTRETESLMDEQMVDFDKLKRENERIAYIYELDEDAVKAWLMWGMEEREAGQTTLHNYRRWMSGFGTWCVERGYLKENPASGVAVPAIGHKPKRRKDDLQSVYIDEQKRRMIFEYFEHNNRQMLLACYMCYYLLIRPKEMMQIRVGHFHVKESLVYIPTEISKTEKAAWVTLPDCVTRLLIDLGTLNHPTDWLIFDRNLMPAPPSTHINIGNAIRDRWVAMREALGLSRNVWFYHLKHTGITDMVYKIAPRQVQLQARHSSLAMTERYMRDAPPKASEEIKRIE